jgi:hypothetical protein
MSRTGPIFSMEWGRFMPQLPGSSGIPFFTCFYQAAQLPKRLPLRLWGDAMLPIPPVPR